MDVQDQLRCSRSSYPEKISASKDNGACGRGIQTNFVPLISTRQRSDSCSRLIGSSLYVKWIFLGGIESGLGMGACRKKS